MSVTIVATIGAANANSYATQAEVDAYFASRLPLVPPWEEADDPTAAMAMATRVLNRMAVPHRTLRKGCDCNFYYTSRQWTGSVASPSQRLAWPRVGMYDVNGNPLDVAIVSASVANPSVIVTNKAHGRVTGDKVYIYDSDSTPSLDGEHTVTVLSTTSFSVPVNVTIAGTNQGTVSWIPQELKDAESELAGQLLLNDTTLDNSATAQGIKSVRAGSVAVEFKENIDAHVLPDAVLNLMPQSWFTDELVEPAERAEFDVIVG